MALTAREVELIQSSFAKVEPIADTAAAIFYKTLFQYDPNLKPLFKGDMKQQGRKLMTTLKLAVAGLDDLSALCRCLNNSLSGTWDTVCGPGTTPPSAMPCCRPWRKDWGTNSPRNPSRLGGSIQGDLQHHEGPTRAADSGGLTAPDIIGSRARVDGWLHCCGTGSMMAHEPGIPPL